MFCLGGGGGGGQTPHTPHRGFGSRQLTSKLPDFRITLLGKELVPVSSAKDLGVILDPNITFDDHILKTASSCMSSLAQISRLSVIRL